MTTNDQTPPTKGKKPTREELRERISLCVEMLSVKGWKKWQIKKAFREKYGSSARSVERYLAKARAILRSEYGKEDVDHSSESYAFYRGVIQSQTSTVREKLKAQENIDKLLGLRKPLKVANTDAAGNTIDPNDLEERKKRVAAAIEHIQERQSIGRRGSLGSPSSN